MIKEAKEIEASNQDAVNVRVRPWPSLVIGVKIGIVANRVLKISALGE